jgi:hypothetical protein
VPYINGQFCKKMGRLFVMSLVTYAKNVDALLNDICCMFNDYFRHLECISMDNVVCKKNGTIVCYVTRY